MAIIISIIIIITIWRKRSKTTQNIVCRLEHYMGICSSSKYSFRSSRMCSQNLDRMLHFSLNSYFLHSVPPASFWHFCSPVWAALRNYNKISITMYLAFYCRFLLMRSWSLLSSRRLWWQTSLSTRMTPRVKCWNFQMMIWRSPLSLGSVAQCCHAFLRS